MKFDIITIFPKIFDSYFVESLISRAQKKKLIKIGIHDLRKYTKDKHKKVDDSPFGGGAGMVMQVEPIYRAVTALKSKIQNPNFKSSPKSKVILFTPRGKKFDQKMATELSKQDQLIFICGRYEGVDERVAKKIADIKLSVGDYVLMGGEIPAMAVIETITRLIPGAIGKEGLLKARITKSKGFVEYEQYTRPENFNGWKVPKVLLSGNHKKIEEWKREHSKIIVGPRPISLGLKKLKK